MTSLRPSSPIKEKCKVGKPQQNSFACPTSIKRLDLDAASTCTLSAWAPRFGGKSNNDAIGLPFPKISARAKGRVECLQADEEGLHAKGRARQYAPARSEKGRHPLRLEGCPHEFAGEVVAAAACGGSSVPATDPSVRRLALMVAVQTGYDAYGNEKAIHCQSMCPDGSLDCLCASSRFGASWVADRR